MFWFNVSISKKIKKLLDQKCEAEARDKSKVVEKLLEMFIDDEITLSWSKKKQSKSRELKEESGNKNKGDNNE